MGRHDDKTCLQSEWMVSEKVSEWQYYHPKGAEQMSVPLSP